MVKGQHRKGRRGTAR